MASLLNVGRALVEKGPEPNYIDLGLPSGLLWATCNVGAETETDYGLYFSWGETTGYVTASAKTNGFTWESYKYNNDGSSPTASNMSKYNLTDGKTVLDLEDDAARVNIGGNWRMPTIAEFQELIDNTTSTWQTNYNNTDVSGRLFTSKTDPNIKLFFPAAGYCYKGNVNNTGSYGNYWSSSLHTSNNTSDRLLGRILRFHTDNAVTVNSSRYYGRSVRAVRSSN